MGETWFTTLRAIREQDPDWEAIAAYREPIARFLARVFPRLAPELRDDVTQEVLCAMRTSVVARFDPDRGRFRDFLRGVVRNQVRAALRARPAEAGGVELDALEAASAEEVEAVDLAARLVRAVRAFHDAMLQGAEAERQVLYVLSDRLIEGLSYADIARKEGISRDAVKRRLQLARRGILRAFLSAALEERGLSLRPRRLNRLAEGLAEAITSRRPADELLGRGPDPESRAVALALVDAVRVGVRSFPGLDSPDGQAFVGALRGVLAGGVPA